MKDQSEHIFNILIFKTNIRNTILYERGSKMHKPYECKNPNPSETKIMPYSHVTPVTCSEEPKRSV